MSKKSIKVDIASKLYPISVDEHEEKYVVKAASDVNKHILKLQTNYSGVEKQDLLAMAALQIATEKLHATNSLSNTNLEEKLQILEDKLNELLK